MIRLHQYLATIRKKPHAVRQRFALLASVVIFAVIGGAFLGVRFAIQTAQQQQSLTSNPDTSPLRFVGNAWRDFADYMEGLGERFTEFGWRFTLDPEDSVTVTSTEALRRFQGSAAISTTATGTPATSTTSEVPVETTIPLDSPEAALFGAGQTNE